MSNYFFDYTSSTPINKEVLKAYETALEKYYINSDALYDNALKIKGLVEKSRSKIADLLGVSSDEIIFTSGASESNNMAVKGYCFENKHKGNHIITTKMEHSSMYNAIKQLEEKFDFDVTYLDVNEHGCVSVEDVENAIQDNTILVSMMAVNNEIGSKQPINEVGAMLKNKKIAFMVDGVQAISKMDINFNNIDMLSMSLHKLYGLKGCGILYKRKNIKLLPLINGGQQEYGLRGGTTNAPSVIVAFKTLNLAYQSAKEHYEYVSELQQYLVKRLSKIDEVVVNTPLDNCIPFITNFSCPCLNSEILMNAFNKKGICVSAQSTCSSKTKTPSKTLKAMGKSDEVAYSAIRISLSFLHEKSDVDYLVDTLEEVINEYKVGV